MQREIGVTVDTVGEPKLAELYALWTRTNDQRELAMISGVEAFARHASFEKGVLLVGAAHRQPLFEKSRLPRSDGPSAVTWDFDWQLDLGPGLMKPAAVPANRLRENSFRRPPNRNS